MVGPVALTNGQRLLWDVILGGAYLTRLRSSWTDSVLLQRSGIIVVISGYGRQRTYSIIGFLIGWRDKRKVVGHETNLRDT